MALRDFTTNLLNPFRFLFPGCSLQGHFTWNVKGDINLQESLAFLLSSFNHWQWWVNKSPILFFLLPWRQQLNPFFHFFQASESVQFSSSVVFDSLWPHGLQHARLPHPSPAPGAYSNSWLLSRWCHPTMSSSIVTFSSCLQSSE